jgi:hypothetical protein
VGTQRAESQMTEKIWAKKLVEKEVFWYLRTRFGPLALDLDNFFV